MRIKPEFILKFEKDGIFSTMEIVVPKKFDNFLKQSSLLLVFSETYLDFDNGEICYKSKIYCSKQPFYLYLLMNKDNDTLVIYFKQEQLTELTMFIQQLLKTFKKKID